MRNTLTFLVAPLMAVVTLTLAVVVMQAVSVVRMEAVTVGVMEAVALMQAASLRVDVSEDQGASVAAPINSANITS